MTSTQQALVVAVVTSPAAPIENGSSRDDELKGRYLSDVQESLGFDDAAFREVVLSAWYDGLVRLSRADLVRDVAREAASELRLETETFHYIALA